MRGDPTTRTAAASPPTEAVSGGGKRIDILPRRVIDLDDMDASTNHTLTLVRNLGVLGWGDGVLQVRVHANSLATGRKVIVQVRSSSPDDEDPAVDWLGADNVAAVTVDDGTAVATLLLSGFAPGFGEAITLQAEVRNDSASGNGGGKVELSASLMMRPGAALPRRESGYFVYNSTQSVLVYVPFRDSTEAGSIGIVQSRMMGFPGVLETVVLRGSTAGGSTVVGFHLNESTTASTTATQSVSAATNTTFQFEQANRFEPGDRIHISVDPTTALTNVTGYYVVRYDRLG